MQHDEKASRCFVTMMLITLTLLIFYALVHSSTLPYRKGMNATSTDVPQASVTS